MFIENSNLGIKEISCESLQDNHSEFKVIDVRTQEEFTGELGHIETAQLETLGPELLKFLESEDKHEQIVFICKSGNRSGQATIAAQDMGFTNVSNMIGGMLEWNRLNFKVEI